MSKDADIIKRLAELGIDVTPKNPSPQIQEVLKRVEQYEKEMGTKINPQELAKYLG